MTHALRFVPTIVGICIAIALTGVAAHSQNAPFFYRAPPPGAVAISKNVQYGTADTAVLRMDIYHPGRTRATSPALIFFNVASGRDRGNGFYAAWARTAASKGLVAIVPDLHSGRAEQDFTSLVAHLTQHAANYGIDREAIAVYAGSGNVFTAFPIVEDPKQTAVKAAVMYYGMAPITEFRRDLPVLYVRAGLDRPSVTGGSTSGITSLAAQAITQNAPLTLLNDPTGHHAFEMIDDDAVTRDAIERTIDFVKRATSHAYQAALHHGLLEATAAARVVAGDFHGASAAYADLLASRPDDIRLRLSYGEALLGDGQFGAACTELARLKGKGLGPRDLGLPTSRACAQNGDLDMAIAWLQSIPKRFLPPDVQNEPAYASLRERPDFRALFQP
jgi:dienelactone hydrolase